MSGAAVADGKTIIWSASGLACTVTERSRTSESGREGSKYGMDDYMVMKYICMGGIDQ